MSFLYPLFLLSGISLAIPILIHLFNLRKYKVIQFPHIRFLKDIQLSSQKQSQIRYKLLLAMRLLFLTLLILAFAQPFFNHNTPNSKAAKLQVIYLDNSYSMSVKNGVRTLLDIARESAIRQVKHAAPGTKFVLLTNDAPTNFHPANATKILEELAQTDISAADKNVDQVLTYTQNLMQNEGIPGADIYFYSDFQKSAFQELPTKSKLEHIDFYGLPVQPASVSDISIDTAFLTTPSLVPGKNNMLVVHSHLTGKPPADDAVLQLKINGQVKSATTVNFNGKTESFDTLTFQVTDPNWQRMEITVNDATVHFNDTFRIAACSNRTLSVLILNEGPLNPYIQAAFRTFDGFRVNQQDIGQAPTDWKNYNLIILNNITRIDAALAKTITAALDAGQSICIFPGKTPYFAALNDGLKQLGDIAIMGIDTVPQTAGNLQQGSALVKNIFDKIPDNVQLPVANWHYSIGAGLSANEQSVISFRNGDPLLASYAPSKGKLYLCAQSADLIAGNFAGSYFFTPFLYEMAMLSGSGNIYAVSAGSKQPVFFNLRDVTTRNTAHILGNELDIIPPQRPEGSGLNVFIDNVVRQPGFYRVTVADNDTLEVGLNPDIHELHPEYKDIAALKKEWQDNHIHWVQINDSGSIQDYSGDSLPLWKICIAFGALALLLETYLLARKPGN